MTNAFQNPGLPQGQLDPSLLSEIVQLANSQSNGQLIERVRQSMFSMVAALESQTNKLASSKDHPLKWLFDDKNTKTSVEQFNRSLQSALRTFSSTRQQFEEFNKTATTLQTDFGKWSASIGVSVGRMVNDLDKTAGYLQNLHGESSLLVDTVQQGRTRIRDLVNNITSEFETTTNAQQPQTQTQATGSSGSNALVQAIETGFAQTHTRLDGKIQPALTHILGATIASGTLLEKAIGNLQVNSFTNTDKLANTFSADLGVLKQQLLALVKQGDRSVLLAEEAKQDAKFAAAGTIVSRFSDFALKQLQSLFSVTGQSKKVLQKDKTTDTSSSGSSALGAGMLAGGGGLLGLLAKVGKSLAFLKPMLRRLPIIGTIINIGLGIDRIRKGDTLGGLVQFAAGLAYMIPGIGTAIGLGIDALLYMRDQKGGGPEGLAKGGPDIFKNGQLWVIISEKFTEWWNWLKDGLTTFFTKTIPEWLDAGWNQIKKAWAWLTNPATLESFGKFVDKTVVVISGFIDNVQKVVWDFLDSLPGQIEKLGKGIIDFIKNKDWFGESGALSVIGGYISKFSDGYLKLFGKFALFIGKSILKLSDILQSEMFAGLKIAWAGLETVFTDLIKPWIDTIIEKASNFPKAFGDWFKETGFGKFLFRVFGGIGKLFQGDIIGGIKELFPGVGGKLIESLESFIDDPMSLVIKAAGSALTGIAEPVTQAVKAATGSAVTNVKKAGGAMYDAIPEWVPVKMVPKFAAMAYDWLFGGEKPEPIEGAIITNTGKVLKPHAEDTVWAAKPGEKLHDRMLGKDSKIDTSELVSQQKQMFDGLNRILTATLTKALQEQGLIIAQAVSQISPGAPQQVSQPSSNSSAYEGERDPAYIHRLKAWHSISPPARIAY